MPSQHVCLTAESTAITSLSSMEALRLLSLCTPRRHGDINRDLMNGSSIPKTDHPRSGRRCHAIPVSSETCALEFARGRDRHS